MRDTQTLDSLTVEDIVSIFNHLQDSAYCVDRKVGNRTYITLDSHNDPLPLAAVLIDHGLFVEYGAAPKGGAELVVMPFDQGENDVA